MESDESRSDGGDVEAGAFAQDSAAPQEAVAFATGSAAPEGAGVFVYDKPPQGAGFFAHDPAAEPAPGHSRQKTVPHRLLHKPVASALEAGVFERYAVAPPDEPVLVTSVPVPGVDDEVAEPSSGIRFRNKKNPVFRAKAELTQLFVLRDGLLSEKAVDKNLFQASLWAEALSQKVALRIICEFFYGVLPIVINVIAGTLSIIKGAVPLSNIQHRNLRIAEVSLILLSAFVAATAQFVAKRVASRIYSDIQVGASKGFIKPEGSDDKKGIEKAKRRLVNNYAQLR